MKKPKVMETIAGDDGTLDRISDLPESLLLRIVSLLPTTKEAFRTSLVSKRWQYFWTAIDNLNFTYTKESGAENNFISFVDYAFDQRTCSKITKLHLELQDIPSNSFPIEQWLSYAIKYNVEHLVLTPYHRSTYTLPQLFYTCSSFITLHLYRCAFDKGAVICWKSLKTLKCISVGLDDEAIVKLLSGCPLLETMDLWLNNTFRRLEINNSNLKTLKLLDLSGIHSLEIFAPYLQHLEISGINFDFTKCRLLNVCSLVSAELTFLRMCFARNITGAEVDICRDNHHGFRTLVRDLLQKLSHVKEISIGTCIAEVLFMLQLDGMQLPEIKCKCLTLYLQVIKENLYGVASLLKASPHVETLSIDMNAIFGWKRCSHDSSYFSKADNIDLESWISNCAFPSLKCVNIICSTRMCREYRHDRLFELLEFLMKNATVLEKFVITSKSRICYNCSEDCVTPYSSQLAAKLSGCPRLCSNFMIIYESDFK